MNAAKKLWLVGLLMRVAAERSVETVSQWVEKNIHFREPDCTGPFSFSGREYLREPLDDFGIAEVTDQTIVGSTRIGKTRIVYGGVGWTIKHQPTRVIYVKPKTKGTAGAEDDARNRFIPMLRASPALAELIPGGARRHEFKTLQQIVGGSIIDWTGSNSVASLASNPCRLVIQDEVDKFNAVRKRDDTGQEIEADASSLADERAKEFSNPKRVKVSTPTLKSGKIWDTLTKKSDLRRRFLPCPHCGKHVVFVWSKHFTVLPLLGCEAFVVWDKEAKRADGTWDLDRVERSARKQCPHCGGHIREHHKPAMDKNGIWKPTQNGVPGHRGYHLSSLYVVGKSTSDGAMALRFLSAIRSLEGPQGFINSDLAEPYEGQDAAGARVELVSKTQIEITAEWKTLLTADVQQKWPYLWFVARAWNGGNSEGLDANHCDTFDDLAAVQRKHNVPDIGVMLDSGFGSRRDAEVYRECAGHGELIERPNQLPSIVGWMPAKGMPTNRRWRDPESGLAMPWTLRAIDPFLGTTEAGKVEGDLFEFAAEFFEDILDRLRKGKTDYKWSIAAAIADLVYGDRSTYWKHMDGHVIDPKTGRRKKRHRYWPDHLLDCEIQQVALASFLQFFEFDAKGAKK